MAALFDSEQLLGDEFGRYCPRGAGTTTIGSKTINLIAWSDILGRQFLTFASGLLMPYLVR
jgi:hypothetical protein